MKIISTDDPQAISSAQQVLQQDGLIAFPTDTIYGLATSAFNPTGIQKVYAAKQRPEEKALPILIGEFSQLDSLVLFISEPVRRIAQNFWPGALTLILPKGPKIPSELSAYATVGVRMPDLPFTLRLLMATGPLATTSANISNGPNPTSVQDVVAQLGNAVDLILDGGPTPGATASTVVNASGASLKILREGPIKLAELQSLFADE